MATARTRIIEVLKEQKRPLASAELQMLLPEYTAGNIYTTTSTMVMKYKELRKNDKGKFYLPEWDQPEVEQAVAPTPTPPPPPPDIPLMPNGEPNPLIEALNRDAPFSEVEAANAIVSRVYAEEAQRQRKPNTPLHDVPKGKFSVIHQHRKPKVHWTAEERADLAVTTYEIKREKLWTTDVAFDAAQRKCLSPDRRRKITSWNDQVYSWLLPLLEALGRLKQAPPAAPQAPAEQPQVTTHQPTQNFSSQTLEQMLEPWAKWLKAVLTEAFVDAMTRQATGTVVVPELGKEQPAEQKPEPPAKHNPEMPDSGKVKLPRVVVYGINSKNRNDLEKEFKDAYDLRWGDPDSPGLRIKQVCSDADMVIAMRNHIPHSLTDTMKREQVKPLLISGHINALRETLEQLKDKQ